LLPFDPKAPPEAKATGDVAADLKQLLLRIAGSAMSIGNRKVLTTRTALEALHRKRATPYLLLTRFQEQQVSQMALRVLAGAAYTNDADKPHDNSDVDAAILLHANVPDGYDLPSVRWGDSTRLGVGDSVMVAGYPLGTDLFLEYRYNRAIVQPTVYSATVGAIVPAILPGQTRLLRLTVPGLGGLSGGAIFDAQNGTVLGMVTTAIHAAELPQPVLYGVPAESLQPFVQKIDFKEQEQ
jgi:hypothetical protein